MRHDVQLIWWCYELCYTLLSPVSFDYHKWCDTRGVQSSIYSKDPPEESPDYNLRWVEMNEPQGVETNPQFQIWWWWQELMLMMMKIHTTHEMMIIRMIPFRQIIRENMCSVLHKSHSVVLFFQLFQRWIRWLYSCCWCTETTLPLLSLTEFLEFHSSYLRYAVRNVTLSPPVCLNLMYADLQKGGKIRRNLRNMRGMLQTASCGLWWYPHPTLNRLSHVYQIWWLLTWLEWLSFIFLIHILFFPMFLEMLFFIKLEQKSSSSG